MDRLCKIRDLQRAVMHFEADFETHYGISLNEGMTLCTLSRTERMCPGELGEALGLTPSNMSKVLRTIESKGLAAREMCCRDRRQFFYSLTPQGRELLESIHCSELEMPDLLERWLRTAEPKP